MKWLCRINKEHMVWMWAFFQRRLLTSSLVALADFWGGVLVETPTVDLERSSRFALPAKAGDDFLEDRMMAQLRVLLLAWNERALMIAAIEVGGEQQQMHTTINRSFILGWQQLQELTVAAKRFEPLKPRLTVGMLQYSSEVASLEIVWTRNTRSIPRVHCYYRLTALDCSSFLVLWYSLPANHQPINRQTENSGVWEWLKCSDSKLIETLSKKNFRNSRETTSNSTGSVANQPEIRSFETLQKTGFSKFRNGAKAGFSKFRNCAKAGFSKFRNCAKAAFSANFFGQILGYFRSLWDINSSKRAQTELPHFQLTSHLGKLGNFEFAPILGRLVPGGPRDPYSRL